MKQKHRKWSGTLLAAARMLLSATGSAYGTENSGHSADIRYLESQHKIAFVASADSAVSTDAMTSSPVELPLNSAASVSSKVLEESTPAEPADAFEESMPAEPSETLEESMPRETADAFGESTPAELAETFGESTSAEPSETLEESTPAEPAETFEEPTTAELVEAFGEPTTAVSSNLTGNDDFVPLFGQISLSSDFHNMLHQWNGRAKRPLKEMASLLSDSQQSAAETLLRNLNTSKTSEDKSSGPRMVQAH